MNDAAHVRVQGTASNSKIAMLTLLKTRPSASSSSLSGLGLGRFGELVGLVSAAEGRPGGQGTCQANWQGTRAGYPRDLSTREGIPQNFEAISATTATTARRSTFPHPFGLACLACLASFVSFAPVATLALDSMKAGP